MQAHRAAGIAADSLSCVIFFLTREILLSNWQLPKITYFKCATADHCAAPPQQSAVRNLAQGHFVKSSSVSLIPFPLFRFLSSSERNG